MDQMGKVVSEDGIQELLSFAQDVLERREQEAAHRCRSSLSLFEMNGQQCTHLWKTIRVVFDCFSQCSTMSWVDPPEGLAVGVHRAFALLVKDFYVAITRADANKQYFADERSWLEAAAIHRGLCRDAFLGVYGALRVCAKLLQEITGNLLLDVDLFPSPTQLEDEYQADLESFKSAVKVWYGDTRKDSRDVDNMLLAKYVLEREEKTTNVQVKRAELLEFYGGRTEHPCSFVCEIGQGSFGPVYKVFWLGMTCARKYFPDPSNMSVEDSTKFEQNFDREVGFLMELKHPHILQLLCFRSKVNEKYIISEIMPEDLDKFIRARWAYQREGGGQETFTVQAALDLMLQMARGLKHLHDHDIVHRDLKPKNILVAPLLVPKLRDEGYADVKLADFGLTKKLKGDLTVPTRPMIGTTSYRAPEAFTVGGMIDWRKADAYSFAIVCSEILAGERPFKSIQCPTTLRSHLLGGGRPRLPESCPKNLAALLKDCWQTTADARPSFTEITKKLEVLKEEHILSNLASLGMDKMPLQRIVEERERTSRKLDEIEQTGKVVSEDGIQELLSLAKAVLERREQEAAYRSRSSLSPFEMNGQQCTRLWNVIRIVFDWFSRSFTVSWMVPAEGLAVGVHREFALILKDFYVAITRANAIEQYFTNERPWLEAAAIHRGVSRDAFLGVHDALRVCVKLLAEIEGFLVLKGGFDPSPKELEDAYQADVESFRSALKKWYRDAPNDLRHVDTKFLAKYVLEREEKFSNAQVKEAELFEFYRGKSEHPCSFVFAIGEGSYGPVFKVLWLGMTCARKYFPDPSGVSEEDVTEFEHNFEREVGFLMKLKHPHILQLLCFRSKINEKYIISEIMPEDLDKFIKARWAYQRKGEGRGREAFTVQAALDLMLQMARGLKYLHDHGIVYRNLKPKNILVAPLVVPKLRDEGYANVKLAGFGLTKTLERDLTVPTRPMIGTTSYLAPGLSRQKRRLIGRRPTRTASPSSAPKFCPGRDPSNLFQSRIFICFSLGGRPRLPESCPMKLASLLKDCWQTTADARPSFTEITEKLEDLKREHILFNLAHLGVEEMPLQTIVEKIERTSRIADDGGERTRRMVDEEELIPVNGTAEERRRRNWGSGIKSKVFCCTRSF